MAYRITRGVVSWVLVPRWAEPSEWSVGLGRGGWVAGARLRRTMRPSPGCRGARIRCRIMQSPSDLQL